VEQALEWMNRYGDPNGDGYLEYKSGSGKGLVHQGWKDSDDAIVNDDGTLATPPIALVEVQGYAYLAKTGVAELYRRTGDEARAEQLLREAAQLRAQFNHDFWMDDKSFFALALQAGSKRCAVISSNPGQALWTGIIDPEKAKSTVDRLIAPDMFNGWGVRTLSALERRYNPIGYHLGTVWPHDSALIAAGCRRYGFHEAAGRIFVGILEAAMEFKHYRLPEVFAGFAREEYGEPVRYPVACHPQAWASGAVPYLLETSLGLQPDAFEKRLRIVQPDLPDFIQHVEIHRLRIGGAKVDLRFERNRDGVIQVHPLKVDGQLDVLVG
jgi:glycogen debranching enzyme